MIKINRIDHEGTILIEFENKTQVETTASEIFDLNERLQRVRKYK